MLEGKRVLGMTTVYVVQQPDTNHAEDASMNTERNVLTRALQYDKYTVADLWLVVIHYQ